MIQKFRYIFSRADKFKLVGLVVLMIIGSVLELLAVAVFNPFIEVMMQTSSIADDSFLQFFFQHTNIDSVEGYLIYRKILQKCKDVCRQIHHSLCR